MTLPAKLSFMASNYQMKETENTNALSNNTVCVHGIREHGEEKLATAANVNTDNNSGDDNEKSEEDEASKGKYFYIKC